MAKGNPFWAKQSGKLGETVLAVVKGEQVQRAYNPEPINPRSKGQTGQRIIFSSAVKFYKSAIARQFKFAFEDKKQKESDYNAFMRHNTSNGMMITREQYLNKNFPSIGAFMLSKGSLAPVVFSPSNVGEDSYEMQHPVIPEAEDESQIQVHLKYIAEKYGLVAGDIVTFIHIKTRANGLTTNPGSAPVWIVKQARVGDASDKRDADLLDGMNFSRNYLNIDMSDQFAEGFAVIFSRQTSSGLLVSDGQLMINSVAAEILEASQDPDYKKKALNSWGMGSEAVLQGTLLPNV